MAKMGRPPKPDAKVDLPLMIAPSGHKWLTETAKELGIDRAEFVRQLIAKGAAAYRAGWRPTV